MNVAYITSAAKPDQLPPEGLPEIAVIGRSNCGKSTLINALTGDQKIARASRTPGRTQMANFFNVDEKKYLVDLPGYGFSKTEAPNRRFWQQLVDGYLQRNCIQHVLFLFDCRRELDAIDLELLGDISRQHPTLFVLTKTDKLSQSEMHQSRRRFGELPKTHQLALADVYWTSSTKLRGIDELRSILFV